MIFVSIAGRVVFVKAAIDALAVVVTGLMVGVEFAVAAFAHPSLAGLPDDAFRAARGYTSRVLGKVMSLWYSATLLVLVAAWGGTRSWLCGVAMGLMLAVMVLSVTRLVPINSRIAAWPVTGEVSRELAARWDRLHWLRVAALAAIFVLLTWAVTAAP